MNNLKLGQRVIAALVVAVGLLSSSAPSDVLRLEVTYTNGGVDFGPICGVPSLPTEVCATFTFQGHPCAENVVAADNALVTALIEFGDATWTEADVNFFEVCYSGGVVFEFNYQLLPITTGTVLNIEAANFPLTITGTPIAEPPVRCSATFFGRRSVACRLSRTMGSRLSTSVSLTSPLMSHSSPIGSATSPPESATRQTESPPPSFNPLLTTHSILSLRPLGLHIGDYCSPARVHISRELLLNG